MSILNKNQTGGIHGNVFVLYKDCLKVAQFNFFYRFSTCCTASFCLRLYNKIFVTYIGFLSRLLKANFHLVKLQLLAFRLAKIRWIGWNYVKQSSSSHYHCGMSQLQVIMSEMSMLCGLWKLKWWKGMNVVLNSKAFCSCLIVLWVPAVCW